MAEQFGLWPVLLTFEPTAVDLYVEGDLLLLYRAKLMEDWTRPITLSTDEKFKDLDIFIRARAETEDSREYLSNFESLVVRNRPTENNPENKKVGLLCYCSASEARYDSPFRPPCCQVEVLVPKFTFDEMLATARLGRLPSSIWVDVKGMDSEIGRGWKWDNRAFANLDIVSIGFGGVPLVAPAAANKSDDLPAPTYSQLGELSEKLDRIRDNLANLRWAVLAIVVLLLILRIFR